MTQNVLGVRQFPTTAEESEAMWVALEGAPSDALGWLKINSPQIDPINIDAIGAEETRPRIEEVHNGYLLIVRGANYNKGEESHDMLSLRVWFNEHSVYSVQRQSLLAVESVIKDVESEKIKRASGVVVALISRLVRNMSKALSELAERTDEAEESILIAPQAENRSKVSQIRYEIVAFKRHIYPQVDVLEELLASKPPFFDKKDVAILQEALNTSKRYMENLESLRERTQIVQDEIAASLTESLNSRMYMLAVLSALFLPLGFMVGLLGVNLSGIPWAENSMSFYGFVALLGVISAGILAMMKWSKWL